MKKQRRQRSNRNPETGKALVPSGPRAEFDCVECGRHVVRFDALPEPGFLLCVECIFYPAWFTDERLAFILDPWNCRNPPPHELNDLGPAASEALE